ncbi:MAG: CRTAC1 family protein, partial [Candidatus Cloacimonetes bacterium]|nr:CRTAC1 family protein [Candidatus Cloacimonadota bacterium]
YINQLPEDDYYPRIKELSEYNDVIEILAKNRVDEISVERSDSLATQFIADFYDLFPKSKYQHLAFYYELYHLSAQENYTSLIQKCLDALKLDSKMSYVACLYLLSPNLRKNSSEHPGLLDKCLDAIDDIISKSKGEEPIQVMYDLYTAPDWLNRLELFKAKALYYKTLKLKGKFGDETDLVALFEKTNSAYRILNDQILKVQKNGFSNNDRGELSELFFWKGKIQALISQERYLEPAAKAFCQALIYGSPRKKFDDEAWKNLEEIHRILKVKAPLMDWIRRLMNYVGIVYEDITDAAGLGGINYTRVAVGDYDNDSFPDLLLNGNKLFHNKGDLKFVDVTEETGLAGLNSSGGLFADFNLDGQLDFMTISHAEDDRGEQLMKSMFNQTGKFVSVNAKAGDIADKYPTEGAAWIDTEKDGYPDLYLANYEKWQVRIGYPDFFWNNENGYFEDQTIRKGFLYPAYAISGLAGRGVAPADFDNDGHQEILVTNYRLQRNLLWKKADSLYVDVAPIYNIHGKEKQGYYGHSIGADWGDYDNDGDLDLFLANLAHPRFIDISDISMLLRNDGLGSKVIGSDTLYYWQFTNVTQDSGITYDELHSDPLWFDADNDGYLDLFITSVYANDRSYLYKNNGDGSFTDVTYLSGARVFNGWGNAFADIDNDGRLDLVVGSGNGTKLLHNRTQNGFRSLVLKPVWSDGEVLVLNDSFSEHPNSPAFGTRVKITLADGKGREMSLIRELSSAKGTTSQSQPILHFGLGSATPLKIERVSYEKD